MKTGATKDGETVVMVFSGEYDLASREELRRAFDFLSGRPNAILDFTGVTYVDSTVLCELARMHETRAAAGRGLPTLVVRNPSIIKIFHIASMIDMFRMAETLDDVVRKDGAPVQIEYASAFATNGAV